MSQGVLAIAEQLDGVFRKITYEVVSEGRRIADRLGHDLAVLVLGTNIESKAKALAQFGADRILVADHPNLGEYLTDIYTHNAAKIIDKEKPAVILAGASTQGKDLMARLAARLNAPLAMDCVAIRDEGGAHKLIATRPMYGGKILADVALEGTPQMVAIRPNAMPIAQANGKGSVEKIEPETAASAFEFIEKRLEAGKVELTEADIVVSGGRGMGGPDFKVIEALAEAVGGAVGASRSAVDEGWRPASDQVGQTGKVVSPNLYIACGISGAIQHLAGMSSSKVIVAINRDPEAPIFSKADYYIEGDLFEIVPLITQEIKKLKG